MRRLTDGLSTRVNTLRNNPRAIEPSSVGLLSAAAYVLYQELRLRAGRTAFRSARVSTLREHLMKLGAWVESSVRRIVLHLPAACLHRHDWQIIARNLGAAPA